MGIIKAFRYVHSVDLLDVDRLKEAGIRCLLLDRDNTLVPRDTKKPPLKVMQWLEDVRAAGIVTCMVSNNFHTAEVCASADELGCMVIHHAMKPAPIAVRMALVKSGVPAEQTLLVGDQLFTDVLAGRLAGVRTVLVRPQSATDLWYTDIFRLGERLMLRGVSYEGES